MRASAIFVGATAFAALPTEPSAASAINAAANDVPENFTMENPFVS